ncbi:MAG: hypothetical protein ACOC56_05225 [Atribacterota bacterium]
MINQYDILNMFTKELIGSVYLHYTIKKTMSLKKRKFHLDIYIDKKKYKNTIGVRGDECIWIPLNEKIGYKIIFAKSEKDQNDLYDNIQYIQNIRSDLFPIVYNFIKCKINNIYIILLKIQNCSHISDIKKRKKYPFLKKDEEYFKKNAETSITNSDMVRHVLKKYLLVPEDEWYKSINLINGKIVDFHRFTKNEERYYFSTNFSQNMILNTYEECIKSLKRKKWKGKIYQGFRFSNGGNCEGYSSDGREYDSYRKLPFIPFKKVKGGKLLDIGCCEGFFCFQAAIHGATKIIGVDNFSEDIHIFKKFNKKIFIKNNITIVQKMY